MMIAKIEWWNRVATAEPRIGVGERLKEAVGLIAANVTQVIRELVDPPYPTPDGKPLRVYKPGESPFTPEQMGQLTAIAKMAEGLVAGPGLRSPIK